MSGDPQEKDLARVASSVPCVETIGSIAEKSPGAVTAADRTDVAKREQALTIARQTLQLLAVMKGKKNPTLGILAQAVVDLSAGGVTK